MLPLPSAAEVVAVQAVEDYPAVSVLCSTDPAPVMTRESAARLSRLVDDAVARLRDEFGTGAKALAEPLQELSADVVTRPTRQAVALYVSAGHRSAWALSVPVSDRAIIDPTFATRDLVRSLHRTPRHVVLVLTDHEARLFDGVGDTLLPAVSGPFPITAASPRRTAASRPDRRSSGTTVTEQGDAFLRTVDRALGTYLALHPAPLVLTGVTKTLATFTHLSRNVGRLAGTVQGSFATMPLPELISRIRPVLDSYLRSRQAEALALLDQRMSAGRVVAGMSAVWLAARAERPEMLAVEEGLFWPARLSGDGDFLEPATDIEHPEVIDDVVDEVIELVLRRGGWIALVDDGSLAAHDRIALCVRR